MHEAATAGSTHNWTNWVYVGVDGRMQIQPNVAAAYVSLSGCGWYVD